MMVVIRQILVSAGRFIRIVFRRNLHLRYSRIEKSYDIKNQGTFRIFRETVSYEEQDGNPVTLVVGFRLKLLGNDRLLHWIFQRICILTTPFWCGFEGFKTKLWMFDPDTHNYLGIYDWSGRKNAWDYADVLVRILKPLSTPNSVWYKIHASKFEEYLHNREASGYTTTKKLAVPI